MLEGQQGYRSGSILSLEVQHSALQISSLLILPFHSTLYISLLSLCVWSYQEADEAEGRPDTMRGNAL